MFIFEFAFFFVFFAGVGDHLLRYHHQLIPNYCCCLNWIFITMVWNVDTLRLIWVIFPRTGKMGKMFLLFFEASL